MSNDAYYYWRVKLREREKRKRRERRISKERMRDRSRTPTPERRHKRRRSSISPLSNRKRHVGEREDPNESKCLGVFGLSLFTTADQLEKEFSSFGKLENCEIVMDKKTKTSRGFGFVNFSTTEDARKAKETLHHSEIEGKEIRVEYSITRRAHTPTPGLYLGYPGAEHRRDGDFRRRRYSMSPIRGPRYSLSPSKEDSPVFRLSVASYSKSPPRDRIIDHQIEGARTQSNSRSASPPSQADQRSIRYIQDSSEENPRNEEDLRTKILRKSSKRKSREDKSNSKNHCSDELNRRSYSRQEIRGTSKESSRSRS